MARPIPVPAGPKWIGVCLSQAHTLLKDEFLCELDRAAHDAGYGILVFNSSMDWYWSKRGGNVTTCIYSMIRFDQLAALIIFHGDIYDSALLEGLVSSARKQRIPVLYLGGVHPGCISIVDDYEEPYKEIIRHVLRDHGVRNAYYIAGLREEENSVLRLKCWQDVMREFGFPCGEDRFAYGNYLDTIAVEIVQSLLNGGKLPEAIFCANDSMAVAVCDLLRRNHLRVPEDVIVTGFDGTPTAYLAQPQLTTCDSNPAALADQIVAALGGSDPDSSAPQILTHLYSPVLSCSCGCPPSPHPRFNPLRTLRLANSLFSHENMLYYVVDQMLDEKELYPFISRVSKLLLPDSALYLNRSLLETNFDTDAIPDHPEEELIMIPHCESNEEPALRKVYLRDMPLPSRSSSGITILNIVHSDTRVCGYYAAHSDQFATQGQLIKRLSDVLNLVASVQLGRVKQQQLVARLENNLYVDPTSGLSNLKGLTRWYEEYLSRPDAPSRMLVLSVYGIPRYSWIYETYGMAETEEVIREVTRALLAANPEALHLARINEDQFVVIDAPCDQSALSALIVRTTREFFRRIEASNSSTTKPYFLEVNSGITHLERDWVPVPLQNLISLATGEMYLNRLRENTPKEEMSGGNTAVLYSSFNLLMEKNLFRFHFQPIVDAHSGLIYAYEALMRTDALVNLTPLEILKAARDQNRLDEVERATVFGIMERYVRHYSDFHGSKVFINTIPGHFLSEEDCAVLIRKYESFLDCFIFELTEDNPTTDEELARLKRLSKPGSEMQIAIDDFGTGHSNILNLLRYSPQIIKIDRGLIAGISSDSNRRLFVRNTIDFAHQNGIKALAEGVETPEELRAVIDCGIDLVQGFYTGRPVDAPIRSISDKVHAEILEINRHLSSGNKELLFYTPEDGETVNLLDLAIRKYSCILLKSGSYTVVGEKSHSVDISIRISDEASVHLTLRHINLKSGTDSCIRLGANSTLHLAVEGPCTLNREGIFVPPSATLDVTGSGSLIVNNVRNYSVGIGANFNDPYGTICLNMTGAVVIRSSGDKVVCIGGGQSAGNGIRIHGGALDVQASGINAVGIGSAGGDADIEMKNVRATLHAEGNNVLLIGSYSSVARVRMSGQYRLSAACERVTAVGTINGTADVLVADSDLSVSVHCDSGAILGTFGGEARIIFRDSLVRIHGEGNRMAGFGSLTGACDTRVESGELHGDLLAGERMLIGNNHSRFVVTGGNIHLFPEGDAVPVSPGGTPLTFINPEGDHYEETFTDRRATWTYKADRNEEGFLGVWIPIK